MNRNTVHHSTESNHFWVTSKAIWSRTYLEKKKEQKKYNKDNTEIYKNVLWKKVTVNFMKKLTKCALNLNWIYSYIGEMR